MEIKISQPAILKAVGNFLQQKFLSVKQYLTGKNTKILIIMFIYFFIIITAILVCAFSIVNSNKVLLQEAKNKLVLTAQNEARKEEQILLKAEKSLYGLENFIELTFNTSKFDNLDYIKSYTNEIMLPVVNHFYNKTRDVQGMYAYLDVMRINPKKYVAEAWVTKDKINVSVNESSYTIKDPTMGWYYQVFKSQKAEWIEPYLDTDLNKTIISYAKPLFKEENDKKIFIGAVGVDIASEDFKKNIDKIKLYKTGYAFLVSKDHYFVASKKYSIKDNLKQVKNGYYKPLLTAIGNKNTGMVKLGENLIAFSKLYNNYHLFVVVPEKELMTPINNLNIMLISFTAMAVLITTIIMAFLLRRLNKIMDSLEVSDNIIMTIANSIEAKDENTRGHIQRVTAYAERMGKHFKLSSKDLESLIKASMLHDIGKIGIPDEVLNKPGKLTPEEFEIMKNHTIYGANILKPLNSYKQIIDLVKHHHERLDGTGYPDGLKSNEINLSTRILTIIDIYDALVTERPYKKAFTPQQAMEILEEEVAKGGIDGEILEAFKHVLKTNPNISEL